MPITISVPDFVSQVGQTQAVAIANLQGINSEVLIRILGVKDPLTPVGQVVTQVVTAVATEEEGGPVGSHGTLVTLTVSVAGATGRFFSPGFGFGF